MVIMMEHIKSNKKNQTLIENLHSAMLKGLEKFFELSVEEIISENAYPYVGAGISRAVVDLHNGFVLKLTEEGLTSKNEVEWAVWDTSPPHLKEILTPCLLDMNNSQKLFMIKAETIHFEEIHEFFYEKIGYDETISLLNLLHELSVTFNLDIHDLLQPQNWGKIEDEYRLINYGNLVKEETTDN